MESLQRCCSVVTLQRRYSNVPLMSMCLLDVYKQLDVYKFVCDSFFTLFSLLSTTSLLTYSSSINRLLTKVKSGYNGFIF